MSASPPCLNLIEARFTLILPPGETLRSESSSDASVMPSVVMPIACLYSICFCIFRFITDCLLFLSSHLPPSLFLALFLVAGLTSTAYFFMSRFVHIFYLPPFYESLYLQTPQKLSIYIVFSCFRGFTLVETHTASLNLSHQFLGCLELEIRVISSASF